MTLDDFLSKLEGVKRKPNADRATALCPGHQDKRHSLSVWLTPKGKIGHKCFRGCSETAIDTALGITWKDRMPPRDGTSGPSAVIVETYDYKDEAGVLLYQNVRYLPKDFKQRAPDGAVAGGWKWKMAGVRRVVYKLPELMATP